MGECAERMAKLTTVQVKTTKADEERIKERADAEHRTPSNWVYALILRRLKILDTLGDRAPRLQWHESPEPRNEKIQIRVTEAEKERIKHAARTEHYSVSKWIYGLIMAELDTPPNTQFGTASGL
jgi:uncharacterized protein (DUF1778 family)